MPITARTRKVIQRSMQQSLDALKSGLDSASGPIKDTCIDPQTDQLVILEQKLEYASKMMSLASAADLDPADLDAYGADFGVQRGLGRKAKGYVSFERSTPPVGDITVPVGTTVLSRGGTYAYVTTEAVTMYQSLQVTYYDPTRNKYSVLAPVIATAAGADYNASIGQVTRLADNSIPALDGVYNPAQISGGTDMPTNVEFAARISEVLGGTDRSSPSGTKAEIMREDPIVVDVAVIQGGDPLIRRIGENVPRDVYVTGFVGTQYSYSFTYAGIGGTTDGVPDVQPILSVVGVYNTGTGTVYVQDTDYTLTKDTGDFRGSTQASDEITVLTTGSIPAGAVLRAVFNANQTVIDLQDYYDQEEHAVLGTDTLIMEGVVVSPYVNVKLSVVPGYTLSEVRTAVSDYLTEYFNTGYFGDGITATTPEDVRLSVLNNVDGINVFLFTHFSRYTPVPKEVRSITLDRNEYFDFSTSRLVWEA